MSRRDKEWVAGLIELSCVLIAFYSSWYAGIAVIVGIITQNWWRNQTDG